MLREVKEEVGIQLDTWKYLGGWPNEYSHKSIVNDVYFLARVENFQSVQTCSDEIEGIVIKNPGTINTEALTIPSLKIAVFAYLHNGHRS
tara:strand:+ start:279 stop:548 length:270 start_codon:yes stop_codon:yes gene_type:complete